MKMRRILPLVILAVAAVFLLSGCDAMLNAIFPTTQIVIDVTVSRAYHPTDWYDTFYYGTTTGKVTVTLMDTSTGETYQGSSFWNRADPTFVYYQEISFSDLKDDTFSGTVYYESYVDHGTYSYPIYVTPSDSKGSSAVLSYQF